MTRHAIDRAKERYGLTLTCAALKALRKQIREGRSVLLARWKAGDRFERHLLDADGTALIAIWAPERGEIVTILPRDCSRKRRLAR